MLMSMTSLATSVQLLTASLLSIRPCNIRRVCSSSSHKLQLSFSTLLGLILQLLISSILVKHSSTIRLVPKNRETSSERKNFRLYCLLITFNRKNRRHQLGRSIHLTSSLVSLEVSHGLSMAFQKSFSKAMKRLDCKILLSAACSRLNLIIVNRKVYVRQSSP